MAAGGRRRSGTIFILLALVLLLVMAVGVYVLRDQIFPKPPQTVAATIAAPSQPMVDIVVLAQPVARGTTITDDLLELVPYPQDQMMQGLFFTDKNEIAGKRASYDLPQGMPITPGQLTDMDKGSYAAFRIPRGMVAISIPTSELTSVSYALQPGDHVNIITSLLLVDLDANFQTRLPNKTAQILQPGPDCSDCATPPTTLTIGINPNPSGGDQGRAELDPTINQAIYLEPSEVQRPRLVSQSVIQDAIVLWMGDFPIDGKITDTLSLPTATPPPADQAQTTDQQTVPAEPAKPQVISLIVTPQDAITLNYLVLSGAHINLALRGSGDTDKVTTEAVTLQFLMDQYNIPSPAKLPYGMEPRMDVVVTPTPEPTPQQ